MRTLLPAIVCASLCSAAAPSPSTAPTVDQKCESLRAKWADRFRDERLSVIVAPPFVVAGDGGEERVRRYLTQTIQASAAAMHRKFFDRQPDEPILILL